MWEAWCEVKTQGPGFKNEEFHGSENSALHQALDHSSVRPCVCAVLMPVKPALSRGATKDCGRKGGLILVGKIDQMRRFIDRGGNELEEDCHFGFIQSDHKTTLAMLLNQSKMQPGAYVSPKAYGTSESARAWFHSLLSRTFPVSLRTLWPSEPVPGLDWTCLHNSLSVENKLQITVFSISSLNKYRSIFLTKQSRRVDHFQHQFKFSRYQYWPLCDFLALFAMVSSHSCNMLAVVPAILTAFKINRRTKGDTMPQRESQSFLRIPNSKVVLQFH